MLRWRAAAPLWWDPFAGVLIGLVAVAMRHALMGFDPRLPYLVFFPFIAMVSVLGRPAMGGAVIAVTVLYLDLLLGSSGQRLPAAHIFAYVTFAGTIIAMGDGFMRALGVAEADRERAQTRENFYASLVRASNDAIVTTTFGGTITGWNPAAARILGYEEQEMVGQNADLLTAPGHAAEERAALEKVMRGETVEPSLTVRRAKSGELLDVSLTVSPIIDSHGVVVGASNIIRDVTRAKQDADALRDSEQLLRFALQAAKAGTWQRDYISGKYTWSPRFYEMHGVEPRSHSPSFENWSARVVEGDRDAAVRGIKEAFESAATEYYCSYRVYNAAGEIRWKDRAKRRRRYQPHHRDFARRDGAPARSGGLRNGQQEPASRQRQPEEIFFHRRARSSRAAAQGRAIRRPLANGIRRKVRGRRRLLYSGDAGLGAPHARAHQRASQFLARRQPRIDDATHRHE
jgi:PAS domain S-box-containing protein